MSKKAVLIGSHGGIGHALKIELNNHSKIEQIICFSRNDGPCGNIIDYNDEQTIINAAQYLQDNDIIPNMVIIASGLLSDTSNRPETQISQFSSDWARKNYTLNTIGPTLVAKYLLPLMPRNQPTYFGILSAKVGSISDNELGGWHSYRASKAALNMMIKNLSIEWKRKNQESRIVGLHPGTVDTKLSKPFQRNVKPEKLFTAERAAKQILDVLLQCPAEHSGSLLSWDGSIITP